jgi:hypothetical protein
VPEKFTRAVVIGLLLTALMGCGASSTLTAPTPAPPGSFVDMAGTWSGTFESANLTMQTITLTVYQTTNCVDGAWKSSTADWAGAISGYAGADSFAGQISFERVADDGSKCTAVGDISGQVGTGTLRWTSSGLTPVGTCSGGAPQSLVLNLHRVAS